MSPEFKKNFESLPEADQLRFRPFTKHSVSFYSLTGEHLSDGFEKESLLAVIEGMERY
jgi:hypothetical protein